MDNKNALMYDAGTNTQISLENARGTTRRTIRVFDFFIACNEVNAYLAMEYLLNRDDTFINFRKKRG